jgi:structural maintenance of chromosome 2
LQLIDERIQGSEHHAAAEESTRMKANVAQFEAEIKAMPEEKKKLQKEAKQIEKDMSCFASGREQRLKQLEKDIEKQKVTAKATAEELLAQRQKQDKLDVELEALKGEMESAENSVADNVKQNEAAEAEVLKLEESVQKFKALCDDAAAKLEKMRAELVAADEQLSSMGSELKEGRRIKEEKELELKKVGHRIAQFHKDHKETNTAVASMEKQHAWITKEKDFFGKPGTDFDFENNNYGANKKRLETIKEEQKHLSKSINKKAMSMFDRAEVEYKDLVEKRDTVLNDKAKIEKVIKDLDLKKDETLKRTWVTVNKHLGSIFSTLLPGTFAKLEPPQGMSETEGLELKVAFNGVWKQSLTELSGGQRSLLALSLVLALLLFKPAPMYILDEIDSALDLSHTQNIGHMIRQHFPHSQFIIVSLKEGMFNNANVLFRTRFVDGCSTVTRYAIREGTGVNAVGDSEEKENKDQVSQKGKKRKAVTLGQENSLVA